MKNIYTLLLLTLFIGGKHGYSQSVQLNFDLDTTVWDVAEPLNLWLDFLKTADDSIGAAYWNSEEVEAAGGSDYFFLEKELNYGYPDFLLMLSYADIRIMSVRKRGEYYKITNILSFKNEEKSDIHCIFHLYAGLENGEMKLFNALKVNSELMMKTAKVGFLTYHYPKNHEFDLEKAELQNHFLIALADSFDVPVVDVDYYFAETTEEIQKIKGMDFSYGDNGEDIPTGRANAKDRMVFTSGAGEYYPHEIIHVLLNPHYPNSHLWINEGVATYFGMSRGKSLEWHLKKLNNHLSTHPEIDLNKMLELRSIDSSTDYRYVLGGYIVQKIFERQGYEGLKKALSGGKEEKDFYRVLEDQLDLKKNELNETLRKWIKADVSP